LPHSYKFNLLGQAVFNASQLTETFGVATVPLNAPVKAGDNLGFSIGETATLAFSSGNLIPWCHLEFDTYSCNSSTSGMVLFEQGSGQNSLRGLKGDIPPVVERRGKGVKFFATVV
jgi:hypothetical protein